MRGVVLFIFFVWFWTFQPSHAQSTHSAPAEPVEVPIHLQHGRIILSAKIQERGPYTFLLDSACTIPTLHPSLLDELDLKPSGRVRINGIAGEERAPTYRGVVLDLGGAGYSPWRVASIPSERSEPRRRDGVLDAGFFRRFVIEFDPKKRTVRLHPPASFDYSGRGEIVPFRFREEIPVVSAEIVFPDRQPIHAEFEVDTGCDSGLCLGSAFVQENKILEAVHVRTSEKFGVGGSVETRNGRIPKLRIGHFEAENVQADFFSEGSPVDSPLAGHIGMGVLGRTKVIFDYSRKRLILE